MNSSTQKMTPEMFEPVAKDTLAQEGVASKKITFWGDVWRRFRQNKGALLGVLLLVIIAVLAIVGPDINSYSYRATNYEITNQETVGDHWFGTDGLGRDIWTRTWYGAGISLLIALLATGFDLLIGVPYGCISGYYGGKVDNWMQRIIEVLYGIPNLIVIILLLLWLKPGIIAIALALGITGWITMARVVRGQMLKLKSQEYVLAARTLGASTRRMLTKHMLPNVLGPVIITVMFSIPTAIFFEAFLAFIGLGIRPPQASLGVLINDGYQVLQLFPYQLFYPALILSLIMLSFNLVGDGLRDALDPKLRQ
ncbi:ABC transporter permease [Marininema halotolerans]|uniref:Oligopeptide transport system permease protein n=1 Tax=Marininema halotolerans TaxID=1155944 RepID=A0A1I6PSX2_9BACL|nr:ABC transporter permease [Marininema halotolerans]SFS43347.1 oligopeptide transport system permease protein [Marininema halotolerans]